MDYVSLAIVMLSGVAILTLSYFVLRDPETEVDIFLRKIGFGIGWFLIAIAVLAALNISGQ